MKIAFKKESSKAEVVIIVLWTLTLLLFSIIFYKERIILSDTSELLINVMRDNKFFIASNRYVCIFSQILPLLSFRLDLTLSAIIMSYSLNFIFIPILYIVLSLLWFKDTKTAISILAFYSFMNSLLFFYPVSEFQMGLCTFLFFNGFFNYYNSESKHFWVFILGSMFLVSVIVFSHPLSLMVFILWGALKYYDDVEKRHWVSNMLLLAFVNYAIRETLFASLYDLENIRSAGSLKNFGIQTFSNPISTQLYAFLKSELFITPILIIAIVFALLYLKKFMLTAYFICLILGFYLLYIITKPNLIYDFYGQHLLQPLTFFIALFLGQYACSAFKISKYYPVILSAMFIFPVYFIFRDSSIIKKRHAFYENYLNLMEKKGISKAIISKDHAKNIGNPAMLWTASNETLLLTSLKDPKKSKIIYLVQNIDAVPHDLNITDLYLFDTWVIGQSLFPAKYFTLKNEKYRILEKEFGFETISNLSITE